MSKNYYPVINYRKCNECGKCTQLCNQGVYNNSTKPEVINPNKCLDGCNACASVCPMDAIKYRNIPTCDCSCKCGDGGCC